MDALHATLMLTPRALAEIVGVSESSIKRWVDEGHIPVSRTAGGHRRILAGDALRFIRGRGLRVLHPERLGLREELQVMAPAGPALTGEQLFRWLMNGQGEQARSALVGSYRTGGSLPQLFDGPVVEALDRLGALWQHGLEGIYHEHVATNLIIEAIHQIGALQTPPAPEAPIALGGSPEGDPYVLPNLMAAAVLTERGYRAINLGPNTPSAAFMYAIEVNRPRIVWVSVSSHDAAQARPDDLARLWAYLESRPVTTLIGGQGASLLRAGLPAHVHYLGSMAELDTLVAGKG